jgi:hypothetical protein
MENCMNGIPAICIHTSGSTLVKIQVSCRTELNKEKKLSVEHCLNGVPV